MSRLKRPIQTARFLLRARHLGLRRPFKQKRNFEPSGGIVASPHVLSRQAFAAKWLYHLRTTVREKIRSFPRRKSMLRKPIPG
jgi:hypothetical protein